jgi:hypothetical protein
MTASGGIGRDWAMLPARPVVGQETPGPAGSAGLIPGESDAGVSLPGKHGSGLERQRPIRKPQVELPEKPGSLRMLTVSDRWCHQFKGFTSITARGLSSYIEGMQRGPAGAQCVERAQGEQEVPSGGPRVMSVSGLSYRGWRIGT